MLNLKNTPQFEVYFDKMGDLQDREQKEGEQAIIGLARLNSSKAPKAAEVKGGRSPFILPLTSAAVGATGVLGAKAPKQRNLCYKFHAGADINTCSSI